MHLAQATGDARPRLGIVYGAVLVLGALMACAWLSLGLPTPACPLRELTGVPCPTCGTTRLVTALLAGRPLEALASNPLVFCAGVAIAFWATASLAGWALGLGRWTPIPTARERMASRVGAVVVTVVSWAWLVVRET